MKRASETPTGGHSLRTIGIVSGFVLKLARQSTGLTQEKLAETLAVDATTVQGWESGRRPLAATTAGDFLRLSSRLTRLGAPASTRRHLMSAIEADQVLSTGVTAGGTALHPQAHPLAHSVHRRTVTSLITWPIIGTLPHQLREFVSQVPRRGPTAPHPHLSLDERTRFFDHLLAIAERCGGPDDALLRRQAVYLLGFDNRAQSAEWLRNEWQRAGRRTIQDKDITGLLGARSASVALASAGDSTRLHDFVARMTDARAEVANLNYWAHWVGELNDEQTSDEFMMRADTRSWTGARLLQHLTTRLDPNTTHLPLNLCTLHTLVASRPGLLGERTDVRRQLGDLLDRLAASADLGQVGHDHVCGLRYALRMADR